MKKVLVFGTFDLMHPGHLSFLRQARAHGDYLVASVARDTFVQRYKGRYPHHNEDERIASVMNCGLVDRAELSDEKTGTYSLISTLQPDVICLGFDQDALRTDIDTWLRSRGLAIPTVTLEPFLPERYKTSKLAESGGDPSQSM